MNKALWLKIGIGVVILLAIVGLVAVLSSIGKTRNNGDPSIENDRRIRESMNNGDNNDTNSNGDNRNNQNQATGGSSNTFAGMYSNCDKNAKPVFTHSPLDVAQMGYIEPLGKMADGHVTPTDHVYVAPINSQVVDNAYEVVMPADGRVVEIGRMPAQYIGDKTGQQMAQDDFRMVVSFNCRYYSIFIHLHKLSDALAAAIGELPAGQSKQLNVSVKAGEKIAHIGGSSFDWTMVDTEAKLTGFVSPELYQGESWKIHTVSPFDMYTGELKSKLEAMSLRTTAPLGGKIDYDKVGSLIGNWFKEGTNGYTGASRDRYYDGHLSIVPHNFTPSVTIYSTGNWQGKAKQLAVSGTFNPESITVESGLTKFEVSEIQMMMANGSPFTGGSYKKGIAVANTGSVVGSVLVQVLPDNKLKVEQFPGKKASEVSAFTTNASTYER